MVALNGWQDRCAVRAEAVSDFVGTAPFHVPFGCTPISASLNPRGFRDFEGESTEVPVTSIDAVIPPGTRADTAKIDVEGFEDRVLNGMRRTLSESRPDLIIECLPDGPLPEIERIVGECGYRAKDHSTMADAAGCDAGTINLLKCYGNRNTTARSQHREPVVRTHSRTSSRAIWCSESAHKGL
jgi:FkbM family methyltransferase